MAGVVSEEGETRDAGNTELTWRSERDRKETACAGMWWAGGRGRWGHCCGCQQGRSPSEGPLFSQGRLGPAHLLRTERGGRAGLGVCQGFEERGEIK